MATTDETSTYSCSSCDWEGEGLTALWDHMEDTHVATIRYATGSVVEVLSNPVMAERKIQPAKWIRTRIEPIPQKIVDTFGAPTDGTIYVRVDGVLVSRSAKYVRPVETV